MGLLSEMEEDFAYGGVSKESKWTVDEGGCEIVSVISSLISALVMNDGKVRVKFSPSANWEQPA